MRLRNVLAVIVVLLGLAVLGVVVFALSFDADRHKPRLIELVREQTGRTLALPGKLSLSFWPRLALASGPATLSGPGGKGESLRFESGRAAVAIRPLLSRQLVVEGVTLTGLRAGTAADGSGWRLEDGVLTADHIASGEPGKLDFDARLRTADGRSDLALEMNGRFMPELESRRLRLDGVEARLDGVAAGITGLSARIGSTLLADLAAGTFEASALSIEATVADGPSLKLAGTGRLALGEPGEAKLSLSGALDDSKLQFEARASKLTPLALEYQLNADRIDVDRLREKFAAARAAPPVGAPATEADAKPADDKAAGTAPADKQRDQPPTGAPAPAVAQEDPLSAIAGIDTRGAVKFAQLRVSGLTLTNLDARLATGDGRIAIDPLTGRLNDGALQARVSLAAAGHRLIAKLAGVDAGGLIRDATKRHVFDGRGDFDFDLSARGDTSETLMRSLSGGASLVLRNGAIQGIDLDRLIQQVRAALDGRLPVERRAQPGESTPFTSLTGRFAIANGVARSDNVDFRADWVRASAAGQIDLGAQSLDWTVRTTIVGTPGGVTTDTARRDVFARMRGLTVPIRLSGRYDDISYRVDVKEFATEALGRELERRLGEKLGLPPDGADEPSRDRSNPLGRLRDLLKR